MIKRLFSFICAICLAAALLPPVRAAALDTGRECTLTLTYTQDGQAFSGLEVAIYRVGELRADGTCVLTSPFDSYPINIHGITSQQEWQTTAQTAKSYVLAHQLPAYQSRQTDETGSVVFTGLETGLYLVPGVVARGSSGTYEFRDFMIYLPTPLDGSGDYDMEARPKCSSYTPPVSFSVVKLWSDEGAAATRPDSVQVDIYRDGAVWDRVVLSGENNWSHQWSVPDGNSVWTVMEQAVPEGYQVSISCTGTTFVITNTAPPADPEEPTPDRPQTGDTAPVLLYTVVMCISGLALVILSLGGRRGRDS